MGRDLLFQATDLMADRRLGDVQLSGRKRETHVTRGDFECTQSIERRECHDWQLSMKLSHVKSDKLSFVRLTTQGQCMRYNEHPETLRVTRDATSNDKLSGYPSRPRSCRADGSGWPHDPALALSGQR